MNQPRAAARWNDGPRISEVYYNSLLNPRATQIGGRCRVAITLDAAHAVEALEEAFACYGLPDIVNTYQGSQFAAGGFTEAVLGRGVRLSMDGKGAWRDNVFVERVWRSIKYEQIYPRACESVSRARRSIGDYIELHNRKMPHSSLADQTPDEAYFAMLPAIKSAA